MDNKELIWVPKEVAERYKIAESDKTKADERIKIVDEYINNISEASKADFKANLESLEEDAAVYTGLMLKVKQAFGKAKDEALNASYALWEEYDKERPNISKKISAIVAELEPLETKLKTINELAGKIQTWNIDRLIETLSNLSNLCGKNQEIFEFVVKNFKTESKQ